MTKLCDGRIKNRCALLMFLFFLVLSSRGFAEEKWHWSKERSSILHYFMKAPNHFQVRLVKKLDKEFELWPSESMKICIESPKGKLIHEFDTHRSGNFIIKESLLIRTEYSPISSGCVLRVFDLESKKEVWALELKGIGEVEHSEYYNQTALKVENERIVVFGRESDGQYIEVRHLKTGKLLEHQMGPLKGNRFDRLPDGF